MWAVVSGATSEPRWVPDGCAFPLLLFLPCFFLLLHSLLLLLLLPPLLLSSPSLFPVILSCCWLVPPSCPTLCDPMDCSPPGSSVHGILQARILEWVAMPSSRGSPQPRDETQVSLSLSCSSCKMQRSPRLYRLERAQAPESPCAWPLTRNIGLALLGKWEMNSHHAKPLKDRSGVVCYRANVTLNKMS